MFEHLTDSNILQSSKTYGKKKVCRSLSISSESSGCFSASTSEDLKNNGVLQFTNHNEYLNPEESSDFVAEILGNYNGNGPIQKSTVADHKFSLYTEEDMLYHYASDELREQNSSFTDFASSGSNYQRTRKNQKNRLSIQQYGSEEMSESTSYKVNIKPSTSVTNSKSASDFLSLKQASVKQICHIPKGSQIFQEKTNGVKSSDACVTNLTPKPNPFKSGMFFSKGTVSQNPLNNTKSISILDLVNRFAANNKQDNGKNNLSKKRTKNKEACESIPAKKSNKSAVIKSDIITTVSYLNNANKNIINISPKTAQQENPKFVDNVEKSKDITGGVNNLSAFRQGDIKTLSKSVEMKKYISVDNADENIGLIGRVNPLTTLKKSFAETQSKAIRKNTCRSFNSSEKKLDSANKPNTPKKRNVKAASKAVQKKNSIPPKNTKKNIVICKKYVLKNKPVELIQSNYDEKQNEKLPFEQSAECIVQNQTHNIIPSVNVVNCGLNMPIIIAPMPPISQGTSQVTSLGIWKTVPFDTNFEPLINDPSSMNASCSDFKDLEFGSDMYFMRKKTNATTIINNCSKQKKIFRPRTLIVDGLEFQQRAVNTLKTIEDNCILLSKEQSCKIFLNNPALLDVTVREFCNHNEVTDFLLDYLTGIDMKKYLNASNTNKGYDFPENFETENLLRVIKDFVHTTISYIVPADVSISLDIPFSHIIKCAVQKMSNKELAILMQVFGKKEKVFKLKDVLSRLSLVALFVIFDEYKKKLR